MMSFTAIVYAFLAGILPALIWLFFLLREDAKNPEPKGLIALAFLGGMLAVAFALPLEHFACGQLGGCSASPNNATFIAWAIIEEVLKYGIVAAAILWRKAVDEPIDYVVYMITAALGFAALENALFLISPFSSGHFMQGLLTDNLRFVGSTLLHVIASATVGFAIGFSWKKIWPVRVMWAITGLILAVALHTLFNFLILSGDGSTTLPAFFTVWTGVIVFFALFEVLKSYEARNLPKNI